MGKVVTGLSMSLDGFIAGPNDGADNPLGDGGGRLFNWYSSGDTEYTVPSGTMVFKVTAASAAVVREGFSAVGALVSGRRTFDITNGWGGRHPLDVPVFVVTHSVPQGWPREGAPFTFVTDGIESAVEKARTVAGNRDVAVAAASIVQQCIRAGLLDEVQIDLVPMLLCNGVRLFDQLGSKPLELECTRVVATPDVTHLRYRIVK